MSSYIPRKCSATNRVIGSKDRGAIQFNIGHVDADGLYNKKVTTVAFCGAHRKSGLVDAALNRIASENGLMKDINTFPSEEKFREKARKH